MEKSTRILVNVEPPSVRWLCPNCKCYQSNDWWAVEESMQNDRKHKAKCRGCGQLVKYDTDF